MVKQKSGKIVNLTSIVSKLGPGQAANYPGGEIYVAPLEDGELLTCVFRAALVRDLSAAGAFVLTAEGSREPPGQVDSSTRLCVSARLADQDEVRSYRRWREDKGGH